MAAHNHLTVLMIIILATITNTSIFFNHVVFLAGCLGLEPRTSELETEMIPISPTAYNIGRGGETRTRALLLPTQAGYLLPHTPEIWWA